MKPKTVGFSEAVESINRLTGERVWRKSWYEVDLDGGDSPDECHEHCKNKVIGWNYAQHFNDNTTLSRGADAPLTGTNAITAPPIRNLAAERTEIAIENAKTVADLEFYVDAAEKYGVMEQYNNKLKQLS